MAEALFVVVSGPPASGKSTLAPLLAAELALPLIAKDTIKDALMSLLPVGCRGIPSARTGCRDGDARCRCRVSRRRGAREQLLRSVAAANLRHLPGRVIEIFCRCDASVAAERYRARAGTRLAGHFDSVRTLEELWNDEVAEPVAGGWPLLQVDTNGPVDVTKVLLFLRESLA